ncbi:protein kinase domain protein [Aspergillus clavatus NRRL 1]|uniref:non-specific serine/threonine protein kinase n=1 Tax=Aspergillus clavatus (strain ATCC 1007 / CBS 513.65 / DSM 816 / NCTC 3887 / NRRL 1 / QM 1276 / 107) TaxID=344612 RepID=A1CGD6_ASPCL|nr:protein kinase domain protein [Aspergillus clavatus NRRL 1]EAW11016.1 protein kinase domain protein [Aspergillus clavatus NRRL 1]
MTSLLSLSRFVRTSAWIPRFSIVSSKGEKKPICKQHRRASSTTALHSKDSNEGGILYEPLEDVERFENYRRGGYHPVCIGDLFHGRYRVVHKLGHGSYSTTWLAQDEQLKRYVAVKVCTAESDPREIDTLSVLTNVREASNHRPGQDMLPPVLDRFDIHGPNGAHGCYVTAPARMSLSDAKDGSWEGLFQMSVARAVAAQLAIVIEQVHSRGFVHGDLHLGNVLFQLPKGLDELSVPQLYEKYGAPVSETVVRLDGKPLLPGVPNHSIVPIWLGKASEDLTLSQAGIILTDFGEAYAPSVEKRHWSHTPLAVRPPEVRFEPTIPLSFPSDIWTLACSIWSTVAQRPLFENFLATEDYITREQIDTLGKLPAAWWEKWEARREYFTEEGSSLKMDSVRSWDDRFEDSVQQPRQKAGMPPVDTGEREALFAILRWMLSFRPEDRPNARQVLESEWMARWAMPEYERMKNSV